MLKNLFTSRALCADFGLLILRAGLTLSLLTHGWAKIENFEKLSTVFPDPLGLGHSVSLVLAIFAEFFCSLFVLAGLWTRAALIPLICTFLTVVFVVGAGQPFAQRELGVVFLVGFIALFFTGAGKISLSNIFNRG